MNDKTKFPRSNRIGILKLPIAEVESGVFGPILAEIHFTPVRVECIHFAGHYEMVGISPDFPELEKGLMAPEYTLKIHVDDETGNFESVEIIK